MPVKAVPVLLTSLVLALVPARARAEDVKFDFGTPLNTVPVLVEMKFMFPGPVFASVPVIIPPGIPAWMKRDFIQSALAHVGLTVADTPIGVPTLTIKFLPKGTRVQFVDHGTGEKPDRITLPPLPPIQPLGHGEFVYLGHFDPMSPQNQPAVFTAGIVTDLGEVSVEVSAQELNFQTDGPIICQALFQRLAPRAPQYGAQINYAGDRLEVYFDPAYTVNQGGIIFGTTSRQGENSASVDIPAAPIAPGDMNCDGAVDGLDIAGFVEAVMSPQTYNTEHFSCNLFNADLDGDGIVGLLDLAPFVARVTGQ